MNGHLGGGDPGLPPTAPATDLRRLEDLARQALDPAVYDYYAGGADDEMTLAENVRAWSRLRLRPRVLRVHDLRPSLALCRMPSVGAVSSDFLRGARRGD